MRIITEIADRFDTKIGTLSGAVVGAGVGLALAASANAQDLNPELRLVEQQIEIAEANVLSVTDAPCESNVIEGLYFEAPTALGDAESLMGTLGKVCVGSPEDHEEIALSTEVQYDALANLRNEALVFEGDMTLTPDNIAIAVGFGGFTGGVLGAVVGHEYEDRRKKIIKARDSAITTDEAERIDMLRAEGYHAAADGIQKGRSED